MLLMEKAKLVVEGAGAVGVAALLRRRTSTPPRTGTTVRRAQRRQRRRRPAGDRRAPPRDARRAGASSCCTRVPDRPGALAGLLDCVADAGANIVEVEHVREGVDLHVRETGVQLMIETRGKEHAARGAATRSRAAATSPGSDSGVT